MKTSNNIPGLLKRAKLYGLPEQKLKEIVERDKYCVYCGVKMKMHDSSIGTPRDKMTIEHFSNKAPWGESVHVGMCCGSCNSSKGSKTMFGWFKTQYCLDRNINEKTVAGPVKKFITTMKKKH